MGYRSSLVIAVKKSVLAEDLINPTIPVVVKQLPTAKTDFATYFFINGWKWYDSFSEIQQIEAWFDSLNPEDFGAMRIGEDDGDTETWGNPGEFGIYLSRQISNPVSPFN